MREDMGMTNVELMIPFVPSSAKQGLQSHSVYQEAKYPDAAKSHGGLWAVAHTVLPEHSPLRKDLSSWSVSVDSSDQEVLVLKC